MDWNEWKPGAFVAKATKEDEIASVAVVLFDSKEMDDPEHLIQSRIPPGHATFIIVPEDYRHSDLQQSHNQGNRVFNTFDNQARITSLDLITSSSSPRACTPKTRPPAIN